MSFNDGIISLREKIKNQKELAKSEEATINYFVRPFVELLGYDMSNPLEVEPQFGTSEWKNEKVDYAIKLDRKPIMIIECKNWTEDLSRHKRQLKHYYSGLNVPFGILTNGIQYKFYSDLDRVNIMDDTPFLEFDFENIDESRIEDIELFLKSSYDEKRIRQRAQELKYGEKIKGILSKEIQNPSDEFIRFLGKKFYQKPLSKKIVDKFRPAVISAFSKIVDERLSEELAKSDYLHEVEDKVKKPLPKPSKRPPKTKIKASFPDGTVYCHPKAVDTYIDVIKKIGIQKVRSLGIEKSFTPLIWDQKHAQYNQRRIQPNCYVFTNLSTKDKIKTLEQIVSQLGIDVKLEKVRE